MSSLDIVAIEAVFVVSFPSFYFFWFIIECIHSFPLKLTSIGTASIMKT